MQFFELASKRKIPSIGVGTWEITPDESASYIVSAALEAGYRIIDTAKIYGNESGVGEAIGNSKINRNELFVTTKLWNDDQGYDRTLRAFNSSLAKLRLDFLDLYLIHWPATHKRLASWRAIESLLQSGVLKTAGVSNFSIRHLTELFSTSTVKPQVNQVEFHPFIYEQQKELLAFCKDNQILIEAYSPLQLVSKEDNKHISAIAKSHNKTPQQIVLHWCIQHGTLPLVRSTSLAHLKSNYEIYDFQLSTDDMKKLDSLSDGRRVTWDPNDMN
jgi:diketogulonate reductase-like aldo/keto reductase